MSNQNGCAPQQLENGCTFLNSVAHNNVDPKTTKLYMDEDDTLLFSLLQDFNLTTMYSDLKSVGITYRCLTYINEADITEAIKHIGYRAEFREKLFAWRNAKYDIEDGSTNDKGKVPAWLDKLVRRPYSLSTLISFKSTTGAQMDKVFNILSKTININRDRQRYTALYDIVKKTILDGLKKNKVFDMLFCYLKLSGSYADNLKICKPNEFDAVMRFEFPAKDLIKIYPDHQNKGNVFIDLTDVLTHLRSDVKNFNTYKFLSTNFVNDKGLLLENKFQQWFESCLTRVLNEIERKVSYEDEEYRLLYKKGGPAHTIYVQKSNEDEPLFSVDFVPGFAFGIDKSVSSREPISEFWEAIPRPLKCATHRDNPSFRTSYTDSERMILAGKDQLKNALRLVKKFRDVKPELQHLKSYYIKTIFLWLDEEVDNTFWKQSISSTMFMVFKRLEEALQAKEIKFFWDPELNMLQTVRSTQIDAMYREVARARNTLQRPMKKKDIFDLFLLREEQTQVSEADMQLVADCLERPNDNFLFYLFVIFCVFVLCFQLYRIFI